MTIDDPILERMVTERLAAAADPKATAVSLLGFIAAHLTAHAGERVTAGALYALADLAVAPRQVLGQIAREQQAADRIRRWMPEDDRGRHARMVARLLLHLTDREGAICPYGGVLDAVRGPTGTVRPAHGLLKVVMHWARRALKGAGIDDALLTVRGEGLQLRPAVVGRVRGMLGEGSPDA